MGICKDCDHAIDEETNRCNWRGRRSENPIRRSVILCLCDELDVEVA